MSVNQAYIEGGKARRLVSGKGLVDRKSLFMLVVHCNTVTAKI